MGLDYQTTVDLLKLLISLSILKLQKSQIKIPFRIKHIMNKNIF